MTSGAPGKTFDHIWTRVIQPVSDTVLKEADPDFKTRCEVRRRPGGAWKAALNESYRSLRKQLKDICYGPADHHTPEELLDGRKIAAVLCAALIAEKGFGFDMGKAAEFFKEKKRELGDTPEAMVALNQWAVKNLYINYKMAYYASLQLVYLTLMRDLLKRAEQGEPGRETEVRQRAKKLASRLNKEGHLFSYPQPPKGDGFDVNIIIGLARTDMTGQELDMFMFAMQLYQLEEHTMDILKREIQA